MAYSRTPHYKAPATSKAPKQQSSLLKMLRSKPASWAKFMLLTVGFSALANTMSLGGAKDKGAPKTSEISVTIPKTDTVARNEVVVKDLNGNATTTVQSYTVVKNGDTTEVPVNAAAAEPVKADEIALASNDTPAPAVEKAVEHPLEQVPVVIKFGYSKEDLIALNATVIADDVHADPSLFSPEKVASKTSYKDENDAEVFVVTQKNGARIRQSNEFFASSSTADLQQSALEGKAYFREQAAQVTGAATSHTGGANVKLVYNQ